MEVKQCPDLRNILQLLLANKDKVHDLAMMMGVGTNDDTTRNDAPDSSAVSEPTSIQAIQTEQPQQNIKKNESEDEDAFYDVDDIFDSNKKI